jgi:hypothetical protein
MSEWQLDAGYYLDQSVSAEIFAEMETAMDFSITHRPFDDDEVVMEISTDADFTASVSLDLLRLIPLMFHNSLILTDYIDEVELEVGIWHTAVRDMVKLSNPNTVTEKDYLKQLAALIGLDLPPEDESTEDEIRRSIAQAIDWYKVKGTYESVNIISMIQKFTVNLLDMYTNDYETFILTEWFVGDENENPPGFDSSYYKSPHFGIEVVLNQVYSVSTGTGSGSGASTPAGGLLYLWQAAYLDNLFDAVEQTRPVHTVPHYILLLSPKTDEFENVITTDGNIQTKVLGTWQKAAKYFDDVIPWRFDEAESFDSSTLAFIQSITKWELGTGSNDINSPSWEVANPVLTGSINVSDIVVTEDKITFSFIVPKNISQLGIRELGLYTTGNTLVLGSTFPSLDKDSRVELRVVVSVYKSDLS